jgi:hypothetical protein
VTTLCERVPTPFTTPYSTVGYCFGWPRLSQCGMAPNLADIWWTTKELQTPVKTDTKTSLELLNDTASPTTGLRVCVVERVVVVDVIFHSQCLVFWGSQFGVQSRRSLPPCQRYVDLGFRLSDRRLVHCCEHPCHRI